jgi:D-glycero-D-manno-heptose 1,7-bisphosphate phosphatase
MISFDSDWSLFLDRDGVINKKRENDYVKCWEEFFFIPGSVEAIASFSKKFNFIGLVTNQKGVGLGLMTELDLNDIHLNMLKATQKSGGRIDEIFYCTDVDDNSNNRKPKIGMAIKAKNKFPRIDFTKSIMVGDQLSDMEFGRNAGMINVFLGISDFKVDFPSSLIDYQFENLFDFSLSLPNLTADKSTHQIEK